MTLEGTNTYLLGAPGSGEVIIVDPGPDLPEHRAAVDAAVAARDATVAAVVFTHHHVDHAQAAPWATAWGVTAHAFSPHLIPGDADTLADGAALTAGGITLE